MKPFRERHRGGGVILNEVKNLVIEGSEILRRCLRMTHCEMVPA